MVPLCPLSFPFLFLLLSHTLFLAPFAFGSILLLMVMLPNTLAALHLRLLCPPKNTKQQSRCDQVELLWVRPAVAGRLAQRGTLLVEFPKVDLPLNTVFATVYAPQRYTYEPWQGDCRQVPSHSGNVPRESRGATQSNAVHARPQRRALASNMITQMVSQSVYRRDLTGNPKLDEAEVAKTARTRKTGVVPVQVDMVASGSAFLFQRLLVVNQSFHVQTTVSERGRYLQQHTHTHTHMAG